ncbi:MAG TPA: aldo/keto reductase [Candidatus Aminicenantes bacterium]|nr:aldo/keto reductase [Candidatus Aminicenantes bacterium]
MEHNIQEPRRQGGFSRRSFLKTLAAAASGLAGVHAGAGAEEAKKGMKYVTLGRTGMRASRFLGDWMGEERMYQIAIDAGVNYWHKIGGWKEPAPYDLFRRLDRDSFYCDTIIHSLDKDQCIQLFERSLARTGLKMIDGFKIHSMYRSAEDVKTKMGAVRAFEELKRQGKTRFLMLSQHINTVEVFEAAIESDLFDLIQVPVNPTVPQDYLTKEKFARQATQDEYFGLIRKAADKDIAVVAMKVFLGGTRTWDEIQGLRDKVKDYLPDDESIATALIHWTLGVPGVKAFGNILFTYKQLEENLRAVTGELSRREDEGLRIMAGAAGKCVCRMCGRCRREMPGGVPVSEILRFRSYHRQGMTEAARAMYAALPEGERLRKGLDLSGYSGVCRYGLPLPELLEEAHGLLA